MSHSTITPSVIKHLITLPGMKEQFPFLRYASTSLKAKEERSCCGKRRRSGQAPATVFETVKASIAYLPPHRIAIIKKALHVEAVTIHVNVSGKETVYNR